MSNPSDTLRERLAENTRRVADELYDDPPVIMWTPQALVVAGMIVMIILALLVVGWQVYTEKQSPQPQTSPQATARPTTAPQPTTARQATQGASEGQSLNPYSLTLPEGAMGAFAPEQAATQPVGGRRYRVLDARPGASYVELDDGAKVWIVAPAPAAEPAVQPVAAPDAMSGSRSGGSWAEPAPTTFSMFVTPQPQPEPTLSMFINPPPTPYATPTNLDLIPNLGAKP